MRHTAGGSGCRRAAAASTARPMVPSLAPLDPQRTRALTTIYAPRKLKTRKNKTAQNRMLDTDLPVKSTLSPFHPLPAIGHTLERSNTKVIVFELEPADEGEAGVEAESGVGYKAGRVHELLEPLRLAGLPRRREEHARPQQLLRENTYDVIEPMYLHSAGGEAHRSAEQPAARDSPKTRFKKAALQVSKLAGPEPGTLLCMRERAPPPGPAPPAAAADACRLAPLHATPDHRLNKLSEIFQSLEMRGRHKDKMKKDNSWF